MTNLEKISDYCETRKIIREESTRLVERDSEKYKKMVAAICLAPVIRGGGVIKDAYFFMRHVDDVLDGDLILKQDPLDYAQNIREDILKEKQNPKYPIEKLAFRALGKLEKIKKGDNDPKNKFLDGIDGMIDDHKRMADKVVLEIPQLRESFIKTFGPHYDIALMAVRSDLVGSLGVNTFYNCQGFAYGIRDLEVDWPRGLINIPKEVLKVSNLEVSSDVSEVIGNRVVKEWIGDESNKNRADLTRFYGELAQNKDEKFANLIVRGLGKNVMGILEANMNQPKIIFVSGNN